jgi:hypothetical protein
MLRRLLSILAAYLVLLHALGMAAMAAPLPGDALGIVCTLDGHQSSPSDSGHSDTHDAPCALCGLGACAVAAPPESASPALPVSAALLVRNIEKRVLVVARPWTASQPRGPPATA